MSSHLFIGEDCWNYSSGTVNWALETIADHLTNPVVAAELRGFSSGLIYVEDFGRTHGAAVAEEIVEVIRTKLRPVALAEPDPQVREYLVPIVDELVGMAKRWRGFEIEAG